MPTIEDITKAIIVLHNVCAFYEGSCRECILRNQNGECSLLVDEYNDTYINLMEWKCEKVQGYQE